MRSIRASVLLLAATLPAAALGATTLPVSGTAVPELAAFDDAMLEFMEARGIEAGVLGVMKDGVVVLERGYGWKDAAHTEVLPATDFISGDAYAVHFPEIHAGFRHQVVPALRSSGVRVIDASTRLAPSPAPRALFTDAVHLSAKGHDQMAQILEEPVARQLESTRAREVPAPQP